MIVFIGLITSFEDIYFKKIRNSYILIGIIGGTLIHGYLLLTGMLDSGFLFYYLINILIACILGFGLYWIEFWSAGDGKLLIAYICMLPIYLTSDGTVFGLFTILPVLVNTFIPFMLFTGARQIIDSITYHENGISKNKIALSITRDIVYLFGISWFSRILLEIVGIDPNNLLIALVSSLMILLTEKLKDFFISIKKSNFLLRKSHFPILAGNMEITIGIFILIYRAIYDTTALLSVAETMNFIVVFLLINSVKKLVKGSANSLMKRKIKIGMIRSGMHISSDIFKSEGMLVLDREPNKKWALIIPAGTVIDISMADEIDRMRRLGKIKFDELYIEYFMPFANLLFIGVLLTLFTNFSNILLKLV